MNWTCFEGFSSTNRAVSLISHHAWCCYVVTECCLIHPLSFSLPFVTRRKKKCERYGEGEDDEDCACEHAKEEMTVSKSEDIGSQSHGGNSKEVPPGGSNHTVVNGNSHPDIQTSDALLPKEAIQGLVPLTT